MKSWDRSRSTEKPFPNLYSCGFQMGWDIGKKVKNRTVSTLSWGASLANDKGLGMGHTAPFPIIKDIAMGFYVAFILIKFWNPASYISINHIMVFKKTHNETTAMCILTMICSSGYQESQVTPRGVPVNNWASLWPQLPIWVMAARPIQVWDLFLPNGLLPLVRLSDVLRTHSVLFTLPRLNLFTY